LNLHRKGGGAERGGHGSQLCNWGKKKGCQQEGGKTSLKCPREDTKVEERAEEKAQGLTHSKNPWRYNERKTMKREVENRQFDLGGGGSWETPSDIPESGGTRAVWGGARLMVRKEGGKNNERTKGKEKKKRNTPCGFPSGQGAEGSLPGERCVGEKIFGPK